MAGSEAVEFHPEAGEEVEAAVDWYAIRSADAARGFLSEVDLCVERVQERPERWPIEISSVRRYIFPRYPFILFYRDKGLGIQIIAVAHQQRRPRYWLNRTEP